MRVIKNCRGVISIFVALMMTGILSLGTFVLEAARLQAARTQLDQAVSSAASSMLSSYNLDLQERYGIFAIDVQRANEAVCRDYVEFNSDLAADAYGNNVTRLYRIGDVEMTGVYNLTYPHILKRQLLTVAKYNLPPEVSAFNMYTAPYVLDDLQMKCQYVSDKMQEILDTTKSGAVDSLSTELRNALLALDKTFADIKKFDETHGITLSRDTVSKLPSMTGTVESEIQASDTQTVGALNADAVNKLGLSAGVLSSSPLEAHQTDVSVNLTALSKLNTCHKAAWVGAVGLDVSLREEYLASLPEQYKKMAETVNAAINILREDADGNLLLNTYISQMFSNRQHITNQYIGPGPGSVDDNSEDMAFAKASCEYVFGGKASETQNQQTAYDYIMALRLIGNLYASLSEANSFDAADTYSAASCMALAYYETCIDMYLLTQHNVAVPLQKQTQILRMENAAEIASAFADRNVENALSALGYYNETLDSFEISGIDCLNYTDSLNLSLWMVPNTQKLLRVADLMQLEMRYQQRYIEKIPVTFLMYEQNTYCRVECSANMNTILPIISIGGTEHSLQGLSLSTLRYAGY